MGDFKIMLIIAAGMAGMLLLFWLIGPMAGGFMGAGMFALAARDLKKQDAEVMGNIFNLFALVTLVGTIVVQVMKS